MDEVLDYSSPPARRARPLSPWLFRASLATLLCSLPLIFMGGLVTTKGAGLAVPDWPNSFGYNMWLFPPSKWVGGIFYEHSHRLLGTLVGLLAILQVALHWILEARFWAKLVATSVLGAVIIQGVLGGLRVTEISVPLAVAHGIFAQLVVCLMAFACLIETRWWAARPRTAWPHALLVQNVATAAFIIVLCQLVIAAFMRHYGAGLAIPDVPLAYGHFLPPTTDADLAAANAARIATGELVLRPVTFSQIWLAFAHRVGAVAVTVAILAVVGVMLRRARCYRLLVGLAWVLLGLLLAQLTLGIATVYYRKPADVTTLHHTTGALILVVASLTMASAFRLFPRRFIPAGPAVFPGTAVPAGT